MDIDPQTPVSQSYTILRIKRKRNEEPLDALVVESRVRRKKSRGGIGVFQFAQTVENDAWEDEKRQRDIQDQISRLARETSAKAELQASHTLPAPTSSPSIPRTSKDDSNRRYTIIKHDTPEPESRRLPTSPPKVLASKDLPPKRTISDFKMYDAILAADKTPEVDSEMEKFMPMLNDYLRLHDISPPAPTKGKLAPPGQPSLAPPSTSKTEDYVWDVFYHRPATLREWTQTANVGTLTGLPPSITDPYDSASDSEEEDEADEDSNAEEYYKNDYPEDEPQSDDSGGSDAFHEDSDHEDMMHYEDDGDDHEWR